MYDSTQLPVIVQMEDEPIHTPTSPFCTDATCPYHELPELVAKVAQQVENGLLTPQEATRTVAGQQI